MPNSLERLASECIVALEKIQKGEVLAIQVAHDAINGPLTQ